MPLIKLETLFAAIPKNQVAKIVAQCSLVFSEGIEQHVLHVLQETLVFARHQQIVHM
jgi:hypothetical protein